MASATALKSAPSLMDDWRTEADGCYTKVTSASLKIQSEWLPKAADVITGRRKQTASSAVPSAAADLLSRKGCQATDLESATNALTCQSEVFLHYLHLASNSDVIVSSRVLLDVKRTQQRIWSSFDQLHKNTHTHTHQHYINIINSGTDASEVNRGQLLPWRC